MKRADPLKNCSQTHMKKKQQRRRADTSHFQKCTFSLSFNRPRPQQSSLVVRVVHQTQKTSSRIPKSQRTPKSQRSYLLRTHYVSTLPGSGRRLLWWCELIGRFLQISATRTGSRRDGRTRTAHLSGSYLLCTDRQTDC